ncbi:hypothetical protein C2845_PM17G06990 [Panicum miliaceum]|uniref:KIB1-4 beta-propeller domain-containing protein n=1 Tax=Panicum miliaceum TaxID=4540 RepID=A0A3L6Q0Q6_PANMI|nr:hypothetical protein C2845_PM17G06990 [Panicum miliaceum]
MVYVYSADPSSESFSVEYEYVPNPRPDLGEEGEDEDQDDPGNEYDVIHNDVKSVLCRIAHQQAVGDLVRDTYLVRAARVRSSSSLLCFFVESAWETLLVGARCTGLEMLKVDATRTSLEPIKSLGSHAIFIGDWRCLSVDVDKFPSIHGNCVIMYNDTERTMISVDVTDASLSTEDQEEVPALIQLLSDYCINIPCSELGKERRYEEIVQNLLVAMRNAASRDFSEYYDSDD